VESQPQGKCNQPSVLKNTYVGQFILVTFTNNNNITDANKNIKYYVGKILDINVD